MYRDTVEQIVFLLLKGFFPESSDEDTVDSYCSAGFDLTLNADVASEMVFFGSFDAETYDNNTYISIF